jgi:hypothetical protein
MKYLFTFSVAFFLVGRTLPAADWRPVNASELAQKTPRVDPGADAEAIFWDIRLEDRFEGSDFSLAMNHYIRIKIFTDLGREKYATVEIPRYGRRSISDVAGRTIKPDGTIVDLKKDAIFDRELVKSKGVKLQGRTFTLPNVAAGDIIEYRYSETRVNELASHMRLYFQRELPMWNVTYHLKPLALDWQPFSMRSMAFQCNHPPFEKEPNGFYSTSMSNVPAFQEEPYMPPEDNLRAWVLIYYEEDKKIDPAKFWKELGKSDYARFKPLTNADSLVKRTASELVTGLDKDEEKLAAIDRFCRTKIRNFNSSAFHLTAEERKSIKDNHSAGDTLKQKAGSGWDVDLLFVALANAAGFDARMARISDRSDFFFTEARPTTYFLDIYSVAVKSHDRWIFFDPSTPYLEPGMLRWQEEGSHALISDPKEGFFTETQYSDAARSKSVRRGTFKLLEDGTLEGSVQYTYAGHSGRLQKSRYQEMTPAKQEEDWKEALKGRLSTAEVSTFEVKDAIDPEKPVVVRHNVTVPGYATRTGKRILLQPAFFQRNLPPRFTGSTRKWDLYFDYGWSEDDEVTIDLPEGWELDQPMAPVSTNLGEVGKYAVEVRKTTDGKKLIYRRQFEWGRQNRLLLAAKAYPQVKAVFDFVQEQDGYTIALKAAGDGR